MIQILLVDDHEVVRTGLRRLLSEEPDLQVVGEAESAERALEVLAHLDPDVVLTDYRLPGLDGAKLCRAIAERRHRSAVIVLSAFIEGESAWESLAAGARGYVSKETGAPELIEAIRRVARGESFVDPKLPKLQVRPQSRRDGTHPHLPPAVHRTLTLAVDGYTNAEIAERAGVSVHTVKTQLSAAYRILGVSDRAEAAASATRLALLA